MVRGEQPLRGRRACRPQGGLGGADRPGPAAEADTVPAAHRGGRRTLAMGAHEGTDPHHQPDPVVHRADEVHRADPHRVDSRPAGPPRAGRRGGLVRARGGPGWRHPPRDHDRGQGRPAAPALRQPGRRPRDAHGARRHGQAVRGQPAPAPRHPLAKTASRRWVLSTRGVGQTGRVRPDPSEVAPIEPDTKDWTWALQRECPDCGFDARRLDIEELPQLLRDHALAWGVLLARPGVTDRPAPDVWSPLEYACHVRDVHLLFDERVALMLREVDPEFADWDQDATAVAEGYHLQDPATVALELVAAAGAVAGRYAA